MGNAQRSLWAAVAIGVGVLAADWFGLEFASHSRALVTYLAAPPEMHVTSDDELNTHLARFASDTSYLVHDVSQLGLSLSEGQARDTIQRLGTVGLRDSIDFHEQGSLPDAVSEYVVGRLELLGMALGGAQRSSWFQLVDHIRGSLGRRDLVNYIDARRRAEEFLSTQRLPAQILKAKRLFENYESGPFLAEAPFVVGSDPSPASFRSLIESVASHPLPLQEESDVTVAGIGSTTAAGQVHLSLGKVFADVHFVRPWFPDGLVDDGIDLSEAMKTQHFGATGNLRVVPAAMVVFAGMEATIEAPDDKLGMFIQEAVETGRCCELRSAQLTVRLTPTSVRKVGERRYMGRTDEDDPRLVALISRRRLP